MYKCVASLSADSVILRGLLELDSLHDSISSALEHRTFERIVKLCARTNLWFFLTSDAATIYIVAI